MLRTYAALAASSRTRTTSSGGAIPRSRKRCARTAISACKSAASARPSRIRAVIAHAVRSLEERALERVRWTVALGASFDEPAFERALAGFRRLYNVAPARVLCAPDVLGRFAALMERSSDDALRRDM